MIDEFYMTPNPSKRTVICWTLFPELKAVIRVDGGMICDETVFLVSMFTDIVFIEILNSRSDIN